MTLKIGKGKITIKDAVGKSFPIYDSSDKVLESHSPFMEDDEEFITVDKNSLSEIIEDKSYAALGSVDTALTMDKNYIPVITQSNKK